MAATQSYVITVGTTPVPESRWARRLMRYEARHRRDTTVLSTAGPQPATGQGRHRRSGTPAEKTVSDVTSPSAWFAAARHAFGGTAPEDPRTPAGRGAHRAPADPDQAPRYTTAYAPGATAYAALRRITAAGEWDATDEWTDGPHDPAAPGAARDPGATRDPGAARDPGATATPSAPNDQDGTAEPGRVRRFGLRPRPGRAGTRPDGSRPRSTARARTETAEPAPEPGHRMPTDFAEPRHASDHYAHAHGTGIGIGIGIGPSNVRPRGAHRASEARPGGRHRAVGPGRRSYSARHGLRPARFVARSSLTALVLLMLVATVVSAWFTATGAAAFANIVRP